MYVRCRTHGFARGVPTVHAELKYLGKGGTDNAHMLEVLLVELQPDETGAVSRHAHTHARKHAPRSPAGTFEHTNASMQASDPWSPLRIQPI